MKKRKNNKQSIPWYPNLRKNDSQGNSPNFAGTGSSINCDCTESAFKAFATFNQPLTAFTFDRVVYPAVQFDLNNEFQIPTTFVPNQGGIYSIIGSAAFNPNNVNVTSSITIQIRVNGVTVAQDNESFVPGIGNVIVEVTTTAELNAGDTVEVFVQPTANGRLFLGPATRFEASRFPSSQ